MIVKRFALSQPEKQHRPKGNSDWDNPKLAASLKAFFRVA